MAPSFRACRSALGLGSAGGRAMEEGRELQQAQHLHCVGPAALAHYTRADGGCYVYILAEPRALLQPLPLRQGKGSVNWVKLTVQLQEELRQAFARSLPVELELFAEMHIAHETCKRHSPSAVWEEIMGRV